jgi:hypothetical protein
MLHGPHRKQWCNSHCIAYVFATVTLPSSGRGCTYRHILMRRIYEVRRRDGLSAMVYIPGFINTGSGIQKWMGWGYTAWWSHKPTFIFFKIRKVGKELLQHMQNVTWNKLLLVAFPILIWLLPRTKVSFGFSRADEIKRPGHSWTASQCCWNVDYFNMCESDRQIGGRGLVWHMGTLITCFIAVECCFEVCPCLLRCQCGMWKINTDWAN